MQAPSEQNYYSFKCATSSFIAKYVVAIFHPFQVLKIRFQSNDGKPERNEVPEYRNTVQAIRTIYQQQGLAGLYKGVHIATLITATAGACFFWLYEKKKLQYEIEGVPRMTATIMASAQGSLFSTVVTQPLWVIRTRVILNTSKMGQIESIRQKTREIYHQKVFSRGLSLNMFLAFGGAIRLYIYQGSKLLFQQYISAQTQGPKHLICGGVSKFITTVLAFPFTTVRTRIMQNQFVGGSTEAKYKNMREIAGKILYEEGLLGFYKGLVPNVIRSIPTRSLYFYTYELFKSMLVDKDVIERMKSSKGGVTAE